VLKQSNQAIIAAIILLIATVIAGVFYALRPPAETITIVPPELIVDVAVAEKQTLSIPVNSQGSVQPRTQTNLVSEVSGKVVAVAPQFESGGIVDANTLLLTIDDRNYQVELKRAEANLAAAESNLSHEKGMAAVAKEDLRKYPRKHASNDALSLALREPQLKEAEARLQAALADLSYAQNNLSRTKIRAPYRGIIKSRNVDLGQYVTTGSQLGDIFAVDRAEVRLPIPADRLRYLDLPSARQPNAAPKVSFENDLGQHWQGTVVRTEGVLDERSRVLFVVAEINDPYRLDNPGETLMMGSFVKAEISGKQIDELIAIPRYILRAGNKVWVLDKEQKLVNRDVKTLRTEGKLVYVYEGLDNGDLICLSTIPNAVAGTKVKINHQSNTSTLIESINQHNTIATLNARSIPQ
jgi:RND family efflux transporter MFP subunit